MGYVAGRPPLVRFGRGIAAFLLIMSSPISGYFLTNIFLEARASASWPSVPGTITRAQIHDGGFEQYSADVSYTYHVGTSDFTGSRIRASDGEYKQRDAAEKAIEGLTIGQSVQVFYNPIDATQSVLHAGAGFQEYALLCIPVVMFAAGVWIFVLLWKTRQRTDPESLSQAEGT